MDEINRDPAFVGAFAKEWGWKQVGVIVHGAGIVPSTFEAGLCSCGQIAVELVDHTRIYAQDIR